MTPVKQGFTGQAKEECPPRLQDCRIAALLAMTEGWISAIYSLGEIPLNKKFDILIYILYTD